MEQQYVYVLRNVGTGEILKGARNNNSPYFVNGKAALKKCKSINDKLRNYPSYQEIDLYKITRYTLANPIDYIEHKKYEYEGEEGI